MSPSVDLFLWTYWRVNLSRWLSTTDTLPLTPRGGRTGQLFLQPVLSGHLPPCLSPSFPPWAPPTALQPYSHHHHHHHHHQPTATTTTVTAETTTLVPKCCSTVVSPCPLPFLKRQQPQSICELNHTPTQDLYPVILFCLLQVRSSFKKKKKKNGLKRFKTWEKGQRSTIIT